MHDAKVIFAGIFISVFIKATTCCVCLGQEVHSVVDDVPECETVYDEKCHQEQVTSITVVVITSK
jgi:hypothetical protein